MKRSKIFDVAIILPFRGGSDKQEYKDGKLYLYSVDNYQDTVVVHNTSFEKIFGVPKYQYFQRKCNFSRRLPIVKVSYKDRSIYRRVELLSVDKFTSKCAALTNKSLGELSRIEKQKNGEIRVDRPDDKSEVLITRGCRFMYYWHHPNSATRMSFRIGLPSLIIGVISLLCSLKDPICELSCKICKFICEQI
ncbi:MAG: hypothetical protein IKA07_05060 [Alistipes sp.]|nr:hypothetical protein [Alistipes sp.]